MTMKSNTVDDDEGVLAREAASWVGPALTKTSARGETEGP
jgi:hypothetical protein